MKIRILETKDPEVLAMLQAFYSRSLQSIDDRMEELGDTSSLKKKLNTWYVRYGHSSIADCGFTTIFIEGISLIAIKALQNSPLFNGQEASTRYIPVSVDLEYAGNDEIHDQQVWWLNKYEEVRHRLVEVLTQDNPCPPFLSEGVYKKAIQARAFDIARSLIPSGVKSNTSWTTSLRKLHEHTQFLSCHPLEEVRILAQSLREIARHNFPTALPELDVDITHWQQQHSELYYTERDYGTGISLTDGSNDFLASLMEDRPRRAELPSCFGHALTASVTDYMDFGTWRDLQRHRNLTMRAPLLTLHHGFHPWYLENLKSLGVVESIIDRIESMRDFTSNDRFEFQYCIPMGMQVSFALNAGLSELAYLTELRSGKTVHPIFRKFAQKVGSALSLKVKLNIDYSPDMLSFHRGTQDITKKEAGK